MKGGQFGPGQAYVAFSRVKSLNSLDIKNFEAKCMKTSSKVDREMHRLTSHSIPQAPPYNILTASADTFINIGHLNVHSYLAKEEDISRQMPAVNTCNVLHRDVPETTTHSDQPQSQQSTNRGVQAG